MCHPPATGTIFLREFSWGRGVSVMEPCLCPQVISQCQPLHLPRGVTPARSRRGSSTPELCSRQAQRGAVHGRAVPVPMGAVPAHPALPTCLSHLQGLVEASSPTLEHKQPLPTVPAPFQPVPSSSRCCLLSQHSSCSERAHHKSSASLLLILQPGFVEVTK